MFEDILQDIINCAIRMRIEQDIEIAKKHRGSTPIVSDLKKELEKFNDSVPAFNKEVIR